jgi:hypothetical protein
VGGAIVGVVGGLIGLGGAEYRLPLLIGFFQFGAPQAVIINKAMSLVVVASALPLRAGTVPLSAITAHWQIVSNLLAGRQPFIDHPPDHAVRDSLLQERP